MTTALEKTFVRVLLFLMVLFASSLISSGNIESTPRSMHDLLLQPVGILLHDVGHQSAPSCIEFFEARAIASDVELSWCAFSEKRIEGFLIYRMTKDDSELWIVNRHGLIPAWDQSYTDVQLVPATTYRYLLGVVFADGSEAVSQPVEVTTSPQSFSAKGALTTVFQIQNLTE